MKSQRNVQPRPYGDGVISILDWVQMGRFAAGLDTPNPGSEFQRADSAPLTSLGNGIITVSDWVQRGRRRRFGSISPCLRTNNAFLEANNHFVRLDGRIETDAAKTLVAS
jgi:hypothetical protein